MDSNQIMDALNDSGLIYRIGKRRGRISIEVELKINDNITLVYKEGSDLASAYYNLQTALGQLQGQIQPLLRDE